MEAGLPGTWLRHTQSSQRCSGLMILACMRDRTTLTECTVAEPVQSHAVQPVGGLRQLQQVGHALTLGPAVRVRSVHSLHCTPTKSSPS